MATPTRDASGSKPAGLRDSLASPIVISSACSVIVLVGAFIVGVILLFGSLTVELDGERLRLSFGVGLIRRSFPLSMIRRVETVRNRWYYGWGIRWTPHGWLFNVSGFDAVQMEYVPSLATHPRFIRTRRSPPHPTGP